MKKKFLYLLAAYLILCIAMALTSCDAEFSNDVNGTYSIDKYFSITMTDDNYQGIAYTFKVTNLKDNILEGDFLDWRHE